MGALAFAIMYILKRIAPKIPNVLVAVVVTTLISWGTGFEKNTVVDISSIKSEGVGETIQTFNETVTAITPLSEKRTEAGKILDTLHDPIERINVQHEINVYSLQIELLEKNAQKYREKIRNFLFNKVNGTQGSMNFYLKTDPENGLDTDGRTWRIKVKNNPISLDNINMSGGGAVVGNIPKGLPSFGIPQINLKIITQMFPYAVIISLLGFMEAISIAKAMAAKTGQRLDPNQELIGQGLANILGSFGRSYPVSGSFSRSAVNLQAGAISGFSSVFTSCIVVIALLFFTPLLYHLPQAVLAAVIMMAVIGLINVSGFIHAWRAQWYDGAISIITFIFTLAFAPHLDKGIMIGVLLSLGVFLYKSMRPGVSSLSRHTDEDFRDSMINELMECEYVDLIRFEGTLFFANASYLEDKINERILAKKNLRHIIIACNGINDMDASGEEALSLVIDRVRSAGIDISFSGINESVMTVLERTHLLEKIGPRHIYPTMEKAICSVHETAHKGGAEAQCPLTTVCHIAQTMK
jgi:MFS superfamily sulfate permease-like transporter